MTPLDDDVILEEPEPEGENPPAEPEPGTAGTIRLPTTLNGRWGRSWRIGRELVGPGLCMLHQDGLVLQGRRTHPVRALVDHLLGWGLWSGFVAVALAMLLTGIGWSWRGQTILGLAAFVVLLPMVWGLVAAIRAGIRAWTQPKLTVRVGWDRVDRLWSDGTQVHVKVRVPGIGRMTATMEPKRSTQAREALAAIRDGALNWTHAGPGYVMLRGAWADRLGGAVVLGAIVASGWWLEPSISAAWMWWGHPTYGPRSGVPDGLTPAQAGRWNPASCVPAGSGQGRVTNAREGDTLRWTGTSARAVALRQRAGESRFEAMRVLENPVAPVDNFFGGAYEVGWILALPDDRADAALEVLRAGNAEALAQAWCAGWVPAFDLTRASAASPGALKAWRDADDLIIDVNALPVPARLLPVRHHPGPTPDPLDACEVPQDGVALGMLPATPGKHRISGFFQGNEERGIVYVIDEAKTTQAIAGLLPGGTRQRCLAPESLWWSGLARDRAETPDTVSSQFQDLRDRAHAAARNRTLPEEALPIFNRLEAELTRSFASVGRHGDAREAAILGWLDAQDWDRHLRELANLDDRPTLERIRQRLDGLDPGGRAGQQFQMKAAEHLMRARPVRGDYHPRLDLAEAWLQVRLGTTWKRGGLTITVPKEAAPTYDIIGRYLLLDVANHLERDLNAGRAGAPWDLNSLAAQLRLLGHDIVIDVEVSSARKVLWAWVTGNWEYIVDRLFKKAQSTVVGASSMSGSAFRLGEGWSNGADKRTADLIRNANTIGWVALADPARVRPTWEHYGPAGPAQRPDAFLVAAASYVTAAGATSGLAVQRGEVLNYTISPKLGGLVVFSETDRPVAILDLKRGGRLPGLPREIRALRSLEDFDLLIRWLEQHKASAFQTHVLFAEGEPRIRSGQASEEQRERRLLVEGRYRGRPLMAIVDLPGGTGGYTLFQAMEIAHGGLTAQDPGWEVVGIANLDVGSYDILEVRAEGGDVVRQGPVGVERAHNLVVWW